MEAPKCRFCGQRHWQNEPHKPGPPHTPEPPLSEDEFYAMLGTDKAGFIEAGKRVAAKFDRNAYQREYMRKRRAAKKPQKA